MKRFFGIYEGRVEQRVDPNRQGRLKIRIVGVHSNDIKVEDLPWAYPRNNSWQGGGSFKIPPLYSYVYVEFRQGSHEYPVWTGGWWALSKEANPSGFGGEAYKVGQLLQLDQVKDAKPEDAPNNFFDSSPNGKNLQLDDRLGRERVVLADQLDNLLFVNTEHGVITLEAKNGQKTNNEVKQGVTLDSFHQAAQVYTYRGWRFTLDSNNGFSELCAPIGHKIRIETTVAPITDFPTDTSSGDSSKSNIIFDKSVSGKNGGTPANPPSPSGTVTKELLSLWTASGNRIVIDEYEKITVIKTVGGRFIVIDDGGGSGGISVKTKSGYITMDDTKNHVEVFSNGTLSVKAKGDMNLSAAGRMTLDGSGGIFLNEGAPTIPAQGPNYNVDDNSPSPRVEHTMPDNAPELTRAQDYPYYSKT